VPPIPPPVITEELRRFDGQLVPDVPNTSPGASGEVECIRFPLGTISAASFTAPPAGAVILRASLDVGTPYFSNASLGITIGSTAQPTLLQGAGDNDPLVAGLYDAPQDTVWPGGVVLASVVGVATSGAAVVLIEYCPTPSP
jgi:hypothetical protein